MRRAIWGLWVLCGCTDTAEVQASHVLTLTHCPADAGPCGLVADGRSEVTVEVCVPEAVEVRAANLTAVLRVSAGQWKSPTDPTKPTVTEAALTVSRCRELVYVASTRVGPVRIEAELAGYVVTDYLMLRPAPLDKETLEVLPTPEHLAANATIGLSVTVRATGDATPSAGTRLAFSLASIEPQTATAFLFPEKTELSGTSGSSKVSINGSPAALTLKVIATPPDDPLGVAAEPVEKLVALAAPQ